MHSHHYLRLRNLTGKSLAWLKCMSPIPQHGTDAGSICGLNVRTNHSACSLGQKVDRNTGQYFSLHNHIRLMWCYYNTYCWNSLFFVGTLGRTMAFFKKQNKNIYIFSYYMATTTTRTTTFGTVPNSKVNRIQQLCCWGTRAETQEDTISFLDGVLEKGWRSVDDYHRPLTLAMSVWNWRERRPLAPPSRNEDLIGGSKNFLWFLFSSAEIKKVDVKVNTGACFGWALYIFTRP